MHFYKTLVVGATMASVAMATLPALPSWSILLGTPPASVAFTMTSMVFTTAVISLAALAITLQALYLTRPGTLNLPVNNRKRYGRPHPLGHRHGQRFRHKRGLLDMLEYESIFKAIDESDTASCGKLLVCHAMAKEETKLTNEEALILKLFPDYENIQKDTAYGKYQWAAYAGSFKNPQVCMERYGACPIPVEQLANYVQITM